MPNKAACFPATQIPPDGRSAGVRLGLLVGRRRSNLLLIFTRNAARRAHSEQSER